MEALPGFAIEALLEGKGLRQQIAGKPAAAALLAGLGARLIRASDLASPSAPREAIATTVPGLDRLLRGGLPRGGLVELSGKRSCGRFSIGIAALASATASGEAAAFVDLGGHLDPQSAEAAGADLTRLLWVRPSRLKEAVASTEMLLATGFPLVVADLGLAPVRGRFVPDAAWVRLERAARAHGAALLLLAPCRISGGAAEAVIAADSTRGVWIGGERAKGSPPRLLCGLASRLTLQKDARARTGVSEPMKLSMGDVPLSHPSPSGPAGGRGDFLELSAPSPRATSPSSRPRAERGGGIPCVNGTSAVSDGILRRSPSQRSGSAPQDDGLLATRGM
ncbi:MAG TPA: hypothetical protein VGK26_13625 [Thermoanaerobaculia bacterium]